MSKTKKYVRDDNVFEHHRKRISKQREKEITFVGPDGKEYHFF